MEQDNEKAARRIRRINAGRRLQAQISGIPPAYICEQCGLEDCRCEVIAE